MVSGMFKLFIKLISVSEGQMLTFSEEPTYQDDTRKARL